jgi:putative Holliday junction resolvase
MSQTTGEAFPSPPGRVLGLDLGEARIGVAVSDPERRMAVPTGTIYVGRPPGELRAIAAMVREHGAVLVVVGHPLSMSGAMGTKAKQAASFAGALEAVLEVPVVLQDERLSTIEAERALGEAGVKGPRRRKVVDSAAATVILQSYLDAHREPGILPSDGDRDDPSTGRAPRP